MSRSFRAKPVGWRGNSHGHALASKGIRLYNSGKKSVLRDPLFFARKHEESIPMSEIMRDVKSGDSYEVLKKKYPDADQEELRRRGIKSIDAADGTNTMSLIDAKGVDEMVSLTKHNSLLREDVENSLNDSQKMSFVHPVKAESLQKRMFESKVMGEGR